MQRDYSRSKNKEHLEVGIGLGFLQKSMLCHPRVINGSPGTLINFSDFSHPDGLY